jgi:hypothetical protein
MAGETVTVCCKLPHGVELRLFDMVEQNEPVMGGGTRLVKVAVPKGESIIIHGNSHPQNAAPRSQIVSGGYAITPNVDKAFWEAWLAANKNLDMVKNGMIFAQGKADNAAAEAKDRRATLSGAERLDPHKLPGKLQKNPETAQF